MHYSSMSAITWLVVIQYRSLWTAIVRTCALKNIIVGRKNILKSYLQTLVLHQVANISSCEAIPELVDELSCNCTFSPGLPYFHKIF